MFIYVLVLVAVLLFIFYWVIKKQRSFRNLPNGPRGLPLIGNIFQLGRHPYIQLSKWADKFGPFYSINLIGTPAIIINDRYTMRDLLGHLNSTGKLGMVTIDFLHSSNHGITMTEGSVWMEQNKFLLKVLRQFGFRGGNQLAPRILRQCEDLTNLIDKELNDSNTGSFIPARSLLHSVGHIVWNALTGEELTGNKHEIFTLLANLLEYFNNSSVLMIMPWLRYIAPEKTSWNQFVQATNELHGHVQNCFDKRKLARTSNTQMNVPFSIIDAYLDQNENCQDQQSTFYGENGKKHTFFAVVSLLLAGIETTSNTIAWLIHYLVAYPDVQRNLQAEVDAVSNEGLDNLDTIYRTKVPYLHAVILEVLRVTSLIPLGLVHTTIEDFVYKGFNLPKGTILLANIYHAHVDKKVWKDPQTFRPERFLEGTEAENKVLRESVVSFQEGRRKCPGEQAAKLMTFWFAYKLVQKYSFHKRDYITVEDYLKPTSGFTRLPKELEIVVKKRNE